MNKTVQFYQAKKKLQLSGKIFKTKIDGLFYIKCPKYNDQRGFFSEIFKLKDLEKTIKQKFPVKQFNFSRSREKVVRGMHAEGWNKLVTVICGQAFCALADTRPDSSTFAQVEYFKLSYDEQKNYGEALFISQGIANSVCALKKTVSYLYLVDKHYCGRDSKDDLAISIFDPDLNIQWPFAKEEIIFSQRDKNSVTLREMFPEKFKLR